MLKKSISTLILIIILLFTYTNDPIDNGQIEGSENLKVHFIDVGQAEATLITVGSQSMLIDAGKNSDEELVVDYITSQGIEKLDYVIGTHPHEDHIGGLDAVIDSFDIGKIIMPKQIATTRTFEDVLTSIQNKEMKVTTPKVGDTYDLGQGKWTILSPSGENYSETNNSSIVIRLVHGNNSFLFTGDAEVSIEKEILNLGVNIESDLLKVGHHGSTTSTSVKFLDAISPEYAVILVGVDNYYGHPHREIINLLESKNIEILRTDELGTIIFNSDGETLSYENKR